MAANTSAFQQALETVEALSVTDQIMLLNILHKRLEQQHRQQLLQEVKEAEQDYAQGKFRRGSVADLMAELNA